MAQHSPDPIFVLRGSQETISCLKFASKSAGGAEILLSGCTKGLVRIWDLSTRRWTSCLDGHHGQGVLSVEGLTTDCIISHGRDGCVHTWNVSEGRQEIETTLKVSVSNFCKCATLLKEDGKYILAVPGDELSEVRVVSLSDKSNLIRLCLPHGHKALGMPMCLKFVSETMILVGYEDGTVALWDLSCGKILGEKKVHQEPVMCLEFSNTAQEGISGSSSDELVLWKVSSEGTISVSRETTLTNPGVAALSLRQDNKILASAGWDSRVRIFGWKKLRPLAVLTYHTATVNAVEFSARMEDGQPGHLLAVGSKDTHISVWSLYNDHQKT